MPVSSLPKEIIDVSDSIVSGDNGIGIHLLEVLVHRAEVAEEGPEERHVLWEGAFALDSLASEERVHMLLDKREGFVIELLHQPVRSIASGVYCSSHIESKESMINTMNSALINHAQKIHLDKSRSLQVKIYQKKDQPSIWN